MPARMSGTDSRKLRSSLMSKVFLYTILLLLQYRITPPILRQAALLRLAFLEVLVRYLQTDVQLSVELLLQEVLELPLDVVQTLLDQAFVFLLAPDDDLLLEQTDQSLRQSRRTCTISFFRASLRTAGSLSLASRRCLMSSLSVLSRSARFCWISSLDSLMHLDRSLAQTRTTSSRGLLRSLASC